MQASNTAFRFLRPAAAAMLLALSSFAMAGNTIKVVNDSRQPWCLRITSEPGLPVLVQGDQDKAPTELGKTHEILSYRIMPGQTCTLQFKDVKDKPVAQDIGLVDQKGEEKGHFTLESKPADSHQLMAGAETVDTVINLPDCTRKISNVEEQSLLRLFADSWS